MFFGYFTSAFSWVFDTFKHAILPNRYTLGVSLGTLDWLYLIATMQRVKITISSLSDHPAQEGVSLPHKFGVPQGSMLGPSFSTFIYLGMSSVAIASPTTYDNDTRLCISASHHTVMCVIILQC